MSQRSTAPENLDKARAVLQAFDRAADRRNYVRTSRVGQVRAKEIDYLETALFALCRRVARSAVTATGISGDQADDAATGIERLAQAIAKLRGLSEPPQARKPAPYVGKCLQNNSTPDPVAALFDSPADAQVADSAEDTIPPTP